MLRNSFNYEFQNHWRNNSWRSRSFFVIDCRFLFIAEQKFISV